MRRAASGSTSAGSVPRRITGRRSVGSTRWSNSAERVPHDRHQERRHAPTVRRAAPSAARPRRSRRAGRRAPRRPRRGRGRPVAASCSSCQPDAADDQGGRVGVDARPATAGRRRARRTAWRATWASAAMAAIELLDPDVDAAVELRHVHGPWAGERHGPVGPGVELGGEGCGQAGVATDEVELVGDPGQSLGIVDQVVGSQLLQAPAERCGFLDRGACGVVGERIEARRPSRAAIAMNRAKRVLDSRGGRRGRRSGRAAGVPAGCAARPGAARPPDVARRRGARRAWRRRRRGRRCAAGAAARAAARARDLQHAQAVGVVGEVRHRTCGVGSVPSRPSRSMSSARRSSRRAMVSSSRDARSKAAAVAVEGVVPQLLRRPHPRVGGTRTVPGRARRGAAAPGP